MFECVYTRKAQKARWCDGLVERKGSTIRLFTTDKKMVCTSAFSVQEDSTIDTPMYSILTDFMDELTGVEMTGTPAINILDTSKKHRAEPKLQGRSPSQIMELLDK